MLSNVDFVGAVGKAEERGKETTPPRKEVRMYIPLVVVLSLEAGVLTVSNTSVGSVSFWA